MSEEEENDEFEMNNAFPGLSMDEVMKAKAANPGMFVSAWEEDEENLNIWSAEEIKEDPAKQIITSAETNNLEMVTTLLDMSPGLIGSRDADGYTSLHRATYEGHLEMMKLLIGRGADVNALTSDGWTPLHSAALWNQAEAVDLLIQNGANVNAGSNSGQTPLHLSCSNNEGPETLTILLAHPNIDITLVNSTGETAETFAIRHTRWAHLFYPLTEPASKLKPDDTN